MAVSVRQFIGGILGGSSSSETYATIAQLPLSGNVQGSLAFVVGNNRLYIWNGTGWFNIALINTNPTITQGPNLSYTLSNNGTPTVITLTANDPEGIPISWSYQVTSGTLGNTATIVQADNVFTITPSTSSEDAGVFSITFTASDGVNIATAASSFTLAFSAADPYYKQSVLLSTTATNNGINNTFVDSSTNNFTITRNGNATQGAYGPFSPAGWSGFFDGTGDSLTVPNNSTNQLSGSQYTIEMWLYPTTTGTERRVFNKNGASTFGYLVYLTTSNVVRFRTDNIDMTSGTLTAETNQWTHIAVTNDGTTTRIFVNGNLSTSATGVTITSANEQGPLAIGAREYLAGNPFTGYISNARLVKGSAVYTTNFTPSTTSLTAVSGTSLLTLQSNRFVDNSTNNFAITQNGDVRITPFSPFDPTLPYSTSVNGGSAYFDGTGDYLTTPSSTALDFGTGDFTIETWVYFNALSTNRMMLDRWASGNAGGWQLYWRGTGTSITFFVGASVIVQDPSASNITVGQWNHIAVSRSGTTVRLFVNGTVVATATSSLSLSNSLPLGIGVQTSTTTNLLNGYLSGVRIVKGTAVYTDNFTLPTASPTAVSGTSLLLNAVNANIFDETGKIVLETIGDAKTSTSVVKYGDTSMAFDGNGDRLFAADDPNINLGSGDFTLECWAYLNTISGDATLINKGWNSTSAYASYLIYVTGGSIRFLSSSSGGSWDIANDRVMGTTSANVWNHIAVTRSGSTFRAFVNGVINNSFTFTSTASLANIPAQTLFIGSRVNGGADLNGYLSDVRITKGYARYTATFTPPTAKLGFSNSE